MYPSKQFLLIGLALSLAAAGAARAQVVSQQFNLSTPGARSLGMGGAFLGLADDATAAYINPAGLTNLAVSGPEVTVEVRNWKYMTPYIAGGRNGGVSNNTGLDVGTNLIIPETETKSAGLAFASFGYVLPGGVTFALYTNKLADFSTSFLSDGWFTQGGRFDLGHGAFDRTSPVFLQTSVDIDSFGGAVAYEIRKTLGSAIEHPLSFGLGLTEYRLKSDYHVQYYTLSGPPCLCNTTPDSFFGRSQFLPANISRTSDEKGEDTAAGLNLGLLWRLGSRNQWSLGAVYRQGPEFETRRTIRPLGADPINSKGTLTIPDIYGLGLSWSRPESKGKTKFALDYQNVRYSQRLGDYFEGRPNPLFDISDSHELHMGVERVVLTTDDLVGTFRAGAWQETAHELEFEGSDPEARVLYPPGSDISHWSLGFGLVYREDYQVDIAVDRSPRANILSFSVVHFF